jgi:hypothetical protein
MDILNPDSYPEPETEYELVEEEVTARLVHKGDTLNYREVAKVKNGTKWTDITDKDGDMIVRVPIDEKLFVTRKRETEASRARTTRAMNNRSMAKKLAKWEPSAPAAFSKMSEHMDKGWMVDYSPLATFMEAQAEDQVMRRFKQAAEFLNKKDDFDGDLVAAHEAFCDDLRADFMKSYNHTAISRSSNQMANLLQDVQREAQAKFLDWAWYMW